MKKIALKKFFALFLISQMLLFSMPAASQKAPKLLFDPEVMAWLKDISIPLLKQAEIDPKDVNIYLIKSNEVNAFVTPSKDIFFYTGLILKAEKAEEVQGVLAHEIGHIKGNHYLKTLATSSEQKVPIILGALLGAGAAALGSAEGAIALLSGGLATTQDNILRHSRTHERQADKIAADLLNKEGFSADGLVSFFKKLQTSNFLYSKTPPEWLVTHPLPKQRISAMEEHTKKEPVTNPKALNHKIFKRMQAKLEVFTQPPGFILRKYSYKDTAEAYYALALLNAIQGKTKQSIQALQSMKTETYSNPFQQNIIGMLYQDLSQYDKANEFFTRSVNLRPDLPLLRMNKARNDIIRGELDQAIEQLTIVSHQQPSWSSAFKQLGIALGKKGNLFESHVKLAQDALLRKDVEDAKLHIQIAQSHASANNSKHKNIIDELNATLKITKDGQL